MKTKGIKKAKPAVKKSAKTSAPPKDRDKTKIDEEVCVLAEPTTREELCCCEEVCC